MDNNTIAEVIKLVAIFFALFHFLVGIVLVSRISSMNNIFSTGNKPLFTIINVIYIFILIVILLLIILL